MLREQKHFYIGTLINHGVTSLEGTAERKRMRSIMGNNLVLIKVLSEDNWTSLSFLRTFHLSFQRFRRVGSAGF